MVLNTAFAAARRAAFALPFCVLALNPAAAKVLATVNGVDVTDEDLAAANEDVGSTLPKQMDEAAHKKALLDYLIDLKLVDQKAAAEKLDQTPDFTKKLAYFRQKLMMETYLGKVTKEGATPEAEQKVYDEAAKAQKPEEEIHALHILVATEAEANKVEEQLKAGEDFGKLADQLSKDPAPRAATSAGSPRTGWCRNSGRSPSPPSPATFPRR